MKCKEIIGNRYGRLVVLEKMDKKTSNGCYIYKCKCDCGNIKEVSGVELRRNGTKSCGCLKSRRNDLIKNISGRRYGKLIAIRATEERVKGNHAVVWECKCDCGNTVLVSENALSKGTTKSCGCLKEQQFVKTRETYEKKELVDNTALCALTSKLRDDNTSGHKGVYWVQRVEMWRVLITCQGKTHNIGYFKDYDEAVIAREEAEKKYFEPILKKYGRNLETTSQ